jgi:hypothetical protein
MNNSSTHKKSYDTERLSRFEKEAKDFAWYKEKADLYDSQGQFTPFSTAKDASQSEYQRMKVNYDLFNNVLNMEDFKHIHSPYGDEVGELPTKMTNRDISSYRIRALMGMEYRRAFGYRLIAVNKEASNRKMEVQNEKIRKYVIDAIMLPIRAEVEAKYKEQMKGAPLSQEEMQQIQASMEEEIEQRTPEKVLKYMQRDHRDPAEVQGQQILNCLTQRLDLRKKFNEGWKHSLLSAYEVYWLGIINGEPTVKVINPLKFNCDMSSDTEYIQYGEWATYKFMMTPSEVVKTFDLTDEEIDEVWRDYGQIGVQHSQERMFEGEDEIPGDENCIRVLHVTFRSLRKVGWLDYLDEEGELQTKFLVDETYKLNKDAGDLKIEWEWIDEVNEVYKIGNNIYKNMGPVAGQLKDKDNMYKSPLPYYGVIYDNMNSTPTAVMDRMKVYQYYFNILMFRIETLTATDKGKKILMNINAVPSSMGVKSWQYFAESTPYMWYNPDEEGMNQSDVNTVAKVLDMSLASDIQKYVELANYVEKSCGQAVGVTDPVLGQTAISERVSNNQQNLVQTGHMLEPYFDLHNNVKKTVLQGLIDLAKVAYVNSDKEYLTYTHDDMSLELFKLDLNLLDQSTLGLYIENSSMSNEIKDTIQNLAHAAMQNQKIELSDVLKVIKQESIQEAEEALLVSEDLREKKLMAQTEMQNKAAAEAEEKTRQHEKEKWQHEKDVIILKEEERRKTVVQQQTILSMGFDTDKDTDRDGTPDILEVARDGVNAEIQRKKVANETLALQHKIKDDKVKNDLKEKEIEAKKTKANSSN